MVNSKNAKKTEQLGISFSTANSQLRKMIMFKLVQQAGLDICHQCKRKIEEIENFSIEHKVPWLDKENAKELFFDLNNIGFSHTRCNYGNTTRKLTIVSSQGYKGVQYSPLRKKPYRAMISIGNQKSKHIGYFATVEEAAVAYDKAVIEFHGENAITNKSLGLI